ncbi:MAG: D-inositol-3-phosphate glycosyltransferase [Gammaproteobacteria bacterium]|nr:D-inositol-3-phosphate glycosyltransferase [Gammaproteobacteria bacterium]
MYTAEAYMYGGQCKERTPNRKIRIAFLIDTIDEKMGGTETQLAMLLERLDRDRFEPYLCFLRDSAWFRSKRCLCPQYNVDIVSFYRPVSFARILRLASFLRRERIDILQIHFRDSNIVGTIAAKVARVPIVLATRRNAGYWHNALELGLLKLLNPGASLFVVNSQAVKRHVHDVEGIPEEKIELIYNGVVLDAFRTDDASMRGEVRTELGIPASSPVVILVANLRPVKAIDVFLDSIRVVATDHPEAHVVIVGEGPERQKLQGMARSLGLSKSVHFLGSRTDVPRLLKASDVGVLSSSSEGLSNAIIEYMAAGLPVVCTAVGGNPELVTDDVNGYAVPVGDSEAMAAAIKKLLADPVRARGLGLRGRTIADELFDASMCVARTQSLYERLMVNGTQYGEPRPGR